VNVIAVFLGGGLGSVVRYLLGQGVVKWGGIAPIGTLMSNVLATALLMGLLGYQLGLGNEKTPVIGPWMLLMTAGFCGGFSTFSTFSADTIQLVQNHGFGWGAANIGCNLVCCLLAGWWSWSAFQPN
jgi:fluoride exporter